MVRAKWECTCGATGNERVWGEVAVLFSLTVNILLSIVHCCESFVLKPCQYSPVCLYHAAQALRNHSVIQISQRTAVSFVQFLQKMPAKDVTSSFAVSQTKILASVAKFDDFLDARVLRAMNYEGSYEEKFRLLASAIREPTIFEVIRKEVEDAMKLPKLEFSEYNTQIQIHSDANKCRPPRVG